MLSLGDCLELTDIRGLKTIDAAREVDSEAFVDGCIFVCPNSCVTYRRENVPKLYSDAFSCSHMGIEQQS